MPPMETEAARKFHRVLHLLTLIQGRPGWNAEQLARELDVDVRTIYRYLDDLEVTGIPYYFDKESNGYRIRANHFLPPIQLTSDESLALSVLCSNVAGKDQIAYLKPAWRALHKVEAQLPAAVREQLGKIVPHVAIQTAQAGATDGWQDVYDTIHAAIESRRILRCVYEPAAESKDDGQEFDLEPYALFFSVRAWYVVGRHSARDAVRHLKLNRFVQCRITPQLYDPPADFSLDRHLGNAWRMIRGERDFDVEIHFDPEFTPTMSDTQWHRTQRIEFNEDGSSVFRCTVSGLDEIVWWALGMGPHCRVIAPAELRDRLADLARRTAAHYHEDRANDRCP